MMLQTLISLAELSAILVFLKLLSLASCWLQNFIANSRFSHPLSRLLRPFAEAKRFQLLVGTNLAASVLIVSQIGPVGGAGPLINAESVEVAVLTSKDIQVITETTFKFPVVNNTDYSQSFHAFHPGVDIRANRGTPIYPIANGKVIAVEYNVWAYGHKVVIGHEHGITSLYAHQDQINVKVGDQVTKDTIIGYIGMTGWTTGPHLHLEIKNSQGYLNPKQLLPEIQ